MVLSKFVNLSKICGQSKNIRNFKGHLNQQLFNLARTPLAIKHISAPILLAGKHLGREALSYPYFSSIIAASQSRTAIVRRLVSAVGSTLAAVHTVRRDAYSV
jgi:hypothetical protein